MLRSVFKDPVFLSLSNWCYVDALLLALGKSDLIGWEYHLNGINLKVAQTRSFSPYWKFSLVPETKWRNNRFRKVSFWRITKLYIISVISRRVSVPQIVLERQRIPKPVNGLFVASAGLFLLFKFLYESNYDIGLATMLRSVFKNSFQINR